MSHERVHELSAEQARRIAIRAQLLSLPRPGDLLEVVRSLAMLQHDVTAAVAPSAELVLWSRLGDSIARDQLDLALEDGSLVEFNGLIRPVEDLVLFRADMIDWPGQDPPPWRLDLLDWVEANDDCRRDILHRLELDGPLASSDIPDTCEVPWRSSGWNSGRNVIRLLEVMAARGEVATAGRRGRDRLWDLADRVYPDNQPIPSEWAKVLRDQRRLTALGIARARATQTPNEPNDVRAAGESAVIEGIKGSWRVDPEQLGQPFTGRVALLSPLDRLVFDRKRMVELFDFDYQLEMYKPAPQRRWGYWALPILSGDRLIGKLDAAADRSAGTLIINRVHWDAPPAKLTIAQVDREIAELAEWLGLRLVRLH